MRNLVEIYTANRVGNNYEKVVGGIGPITVVEYEENGTNYRIVSDMFDAKGSFRTATNIQRLQVKVGTVWMDLKFDNVLEYVPSTANDLTFVDETTGVIVEQPYVVVDEPVTDEEGNPTGETVEVITTTLKDGVITEFQFLTNTIYPTIHQVISSGIKRKHNIV